MVRIPSLSRATAILLVATASCGAWNIALAGPIPGVESFAKTPVEFKVPPSTEVWSIGNDEYLVTFRWKPETKVAFASVAGTFNNWDRADLPMEGPDEEGNFRVTARIGGGEWFYKFVADSSVWSADPLNPLVQTEGDGNSILRLGALAMLQGRTAARGDNRVETLALLHNPATRIYYDLEAENAIAIRLRSLAHDLEGAQIDFVRRDGSVLARPLVFAGGDSIYDFWEIRTTIVDEQPQATSTAGGKNEVTNLDEFDPTMSATSKPPGSTPPSPLVGYRLTAIDGTTSSTLAGSWPLVLDTKQLITTPDWSRNVVWYQIMVDRFRDGDPKNNPEFTKGTERSTVTHPWKSEWYTEQPWERENGRTFWRWGMYDRLYGGDFQGVIDKLDYLKDLGVTGIYFNPLFEATNSHKYNARSYVHADDGYGTPGEFARSTAAEDPLRPETWEWNESDKKLLQLIEESHKRGIRVIFDGVFNHLGSDAPTFQDVKAKGQNSPYAGWYDVTSWEPFTYRGWAGHDGLPQFRKDPVHGIADEGLREHIYAVTKRWMDPNGDGNPADGIDGWRLDVPMDVPKPFWVGWRKVVKAINPDAYIVGEIWDPADEWLDGTTFDAVMNYQYAQSCFRFFGNREKKITPSQFNRELGLLRIRYPRAHTMVMQNLFDSHDTDRWVSRLANPDKAYDAGNRLQDEGVVYFDQKPAAEHWRKLKQMALFHATYIGSPMIWYGTEVGMFGADDPRSRMPMWWEDLGKFDHPDYQVDAKLQWLFRDLFKMRKDSAALQHGDFRTIITDDSTGVFAYARMLGSNGVIVVMNTGDAPAKVTISRAALDALRSTGDSGISTNLSLPKQYEQLARDFWLNDGVTIRLGDEVIIENLPAGGAVPIEVGTGGFEKWGRL